MKIRCEHEIVKKKKKGSIYIVFKYSTERSNIYEQCMFLLGPSWLIYIKPGTDFFGFA